MAMARTTMDFFESQDKARKKTVLLTLYFLLAVVFIILGVYVAVVIALMNIHEPFVGFRHPRIFCWVAAGVLAVVLIGSIAKIITLSKGGETVALMLGALPVDPNTTDPRERRLLNVVEEMAIASGVPVPRVFLLEDEKGINAFAAGFSPGDAVVAVTRGCMTGLTRDELQGVVAHEFSHILNGDMRLNIRLMGIIAGILAIGIIGRLILRGTSSRRSGSSGKKGSGAGAIMIMGLIIMAVGYIGVFFGKLIKSAVSRQREFLADASAVQFTRNPSGIASALGKIGGLSGSRIRNSHAEEASHLFFGNGLGKSFLRLLETHPPVKERIRRIDPAFAGGLREKSLEPGEFQPPPSAAGISYLATGAGSVSGEPEGISVPPDRLVSMVGAPEPDHLAFASRLVADLHPMVAEAAREPFGARALIYCLLLNRGTDARKIQMERLDQYADPAVVNQSQELIPIVDGIGRAYRLPLADLAMPALRLLSPIQYTDFRNNVNHLIQADRKISLFEYALKRIVIHRLDVLLGEAGPPSVRYHALDHVQVECFILLSILAWWGTGDPVVAAASFKRGIGELGAGREPSILPRDKCGMKALDSSLDKLARAAPRVKKEILRACIACISVDSMITVSEAELLRAIAGSLDCPIPPIIPGKIEQAEAQ